MLINSLCEVQVCRVGIYVLKNNKTSSCPPPSLKYTILGIVGSPYTPLKDIIDIYHMIDTCSGKLHNSLRYEYWSGLPLPSPGAPPHAGIKPALTGGFFTTEPSGRCCSACNSFPEGFSSPQTETPYLLNNYFYPPFLPAPTNSLSTFCLYGFDYVPHRVKPYNICLVVLDLFSLSIISSRFIYVVACVKISFF